MERIIKFRYWDSEKQHMFHSDSQEDAKLLVAKLGSSIIGAFFNNFYGLDGIEQFTGLTDKNGVEIYEGDVIAITGNPNVKQVVFKKACFYTLSAKNTSEYRLGGWDIDSISILGNIHDNPELLTKP